MATVKTDDLPSYQRVQREDSTGRGYFEIECTIGRVYLDGGDSHPHIVALQMIGEHTVNGTSGTFYFPAEDGSTCVVAVDFERRPS